MPSSFRPACPRQDPAPSHNLSHYPSVIDDQVSLIYISIIPRSRLVSQLLELPRCCLDACLSFQSACGGVIRHAENLKRSFAPRLWNLHAASLMKVSGWSTPPAHEYHWTLLRTLAAFQLKCYIIFPDVDHVFFLQLWGKLYCIDLFSIRYTIKHLVGFLQTCDPPNCCA